MKYLLVACCFFLYSCSRTNVETIVIRGSDTEVNLVLQLAEVFMDADPKVAVAVTGGGSGTGIAALMNKKTDLANSSRAFTDAELKMAEERDVDVLPLVFAMDALTFIVHKDLGIDSLTLSDIRHIYTGQSTNWQAFGGPDLPISLYGRQGNSGTFIFIQRNILKADYSLQMKQMNGTSQIIESIKNDVAGIGYVGIGYLIDEEGQVDDGIKILSIQGDDQHQAVSPVDFENVRSGAYAIIRPLYQYLDGTPSGKLKEFLLFELAPQGQKIIAENGYFPISEKYTSQNQQYLSNE